MRVVFVGKGGAGKSVIAGSMARLLARRGRRVLALDSDLMPGLAYSLGAQPPALPPLNEAVERGEDKRWRFKRGIGPVRAVQRCTTPAPDGVRLLQCGKYDQDGLAPIAAAVQGFHLVARALASAPALRDWSIIGDMPAGPRQLAYDWAPYAGIHLLVSDPGMAAMVTARTIARVARERPGPDVALVVNRARDRDDVERVERFLGLRAIAVVPYDPAVVEAERLGRALIDHAPGSAAMEAVEGLVDRLSAGRLAA